MKSTPDHDATGAKIGDPKNSNKQQLEHTLRALESWAKLSPKEKDVFIKKPVDSFNGRASDVLTSNESHKKTYE